MGPAPMNNIPRTFARSSIFQGHRSCKILVGWPVSRPWMSGVASARHCQKNFEMKVKRRPIYSEPSAYSGRSTVGCWDVSGFRDDWLLVPYVYGTGNESIINSCVTYPNRMYWTLPQSQYGAKVFSKYKLCLQKIFSKYKLCLQNPAASLCVLVSVLCLVRYWL